MMNVLDEPHDTDNWDYRIERMFETLDSIDRSDSSVEGAPIPYVLAIVAERVNFARSDLHAQFMPETKRERIAADLDAVQSLYDTVRAKYRR